MATSRLVRVAAVQSAPVGFDLGASLEKVEALALDAKHTAGDLVVIPDAYPRHLDFPVGSRSTENRTWYQRYVQVIVCLDRHA